MASEQVPTLLRYAADLLDEASGASVEGLLEVDGDSGLEASVRRAYLGGVSRVWRPFLEYLAERPDEWVPWPELCEHIDRTPRQASGMLGAAERRVGAEHLPYDKRTNESVPEFRMSAEVAGYVLALAE